MSTTVRVKIVGLLVSQQPTLSCAWLHLLSHCIGDAESSRGKARRTGTWPSCPLKQRTDRGSSKVSSTGMLSSLAFLDLVVGGNGSGAEIGQFRSFLIILHTPARETTILRVTITRDGCDGATSIGPVQGLVIVMSAPLDGEVGLTFWLCDGEYGCRTWW